MLQKREDKQARLYASIASGDERYMAKDLYNKLFDWRGIITSLGINENSLCCAGGKYYYFETPTYLPELGTNLEALKYLVEKLNGGIQGRIF